jgi:hypothetical protein
MDEGEKEKSGNMGCIAMLVIGVLIVWGIIGMAEGDGFLGGIGNQFKAIGILIVGVLAVIGLITVIRKG